MLFNSTDLLDNLRPVSPKPGHMERVRTPLGTSGATEKDQKPFRERFLKINVRHITDGQVMYPMSSFIYTNFLYCVYFNMYDL